MGVDVVSLTLNKERLFTDLSVPDSDEFLHQLAMMGVDVESSDEKEIVVDITPNRPDLLSQPGLTRAVKAFLIEPGLKTYTTKKSKLKVRVDPSLKTIRPYTACAVITNLKLDEEKLKELIDIQEKLHVTFCRNRKRAAIGVYPMEAIHGNITFKALPPKKVKFRPLESKKVMTGPEILEKHPKGREFAHLLKDLPLFPVFVDSKDEVLSLTPVINSHKTGKVTVKTTDVFIEASGHDFRICHEIMQMMCAAFADLGGKICTVDVQYGKKTERTPDMSTKEQTFYGYYVNRRLGINVTKEQLPDLLAKMGLGFRDGRIKDTFHAVVPAYRVDFLHQIDVVEDVAIAYGYDNIVPELPDLATVASESPQTLFADKVRDILAGYGLLEAKNYHLLGKHHQFSENLVPLLSSVSEEYDALRQSLLACLLQTLKINKVHEYPQQLFEIGNVFEMQESVLETTHLGISVAGDVDYTRIRQVVDGLLLGLGLQGEFSPVDDSRFLKGRSALLKVNDLEIGTLGELNPALLAQAELIVPVAGAEIDMSALLKVSKN
ncbi:MAG: phenylalanine--tRNA ligase subunit beta [Candidatus Woesearchaeota archaeon]|nr:phenylalanine--tRNA ligase subunit beta [Candidatus Woesearchaeota archaeon]